MVRAKKYTGIFYKELFLSSLAVISIVLLFFEYFTQPSNDIIRLISRFDFFVAILFLADFFFELFRSQNKRDYFRKNWFLLLASIPIVDSWAEILRGLRLLVLFRLVRAGEHLVYVAHRSKH